MGVLDASYLLNVNDTHHLELSMMGHCWWAGGQNFQGNHPWCTMLADLYKHIHRDCKDTAHCPPYTLASWDCQERVEALHRGGRLSSTWGGQQRASRPRRRSRSSSQSCSQTPAQRDRNGCSHGSSPCTPSRCHCGTAISPDADTMPKLASAANIPFHAWSSHSCGGMDWASLDDEDVWENDFQTQHTPVHHVVRWEDGSCGEPVAGRMEASRGSPGW